MPLSETVLILMILLAVGMVAAGLLRNLPIPYTVILLVIGMLLNGAAAVWEPLQPLQEFQLTPEIVLFIFLPTLIFESGLNLNARQLIKDIGPVMVLAVPALLFSTVVVGIGMSFNLPISITVALLFGALISATDPVAVIALFKELGAPQRLTVLVEGESLLNDATAIVAFNILLGLTGAGVLTWSDGGGAVLQFFKVFFGGAVVGVGFGLLVSWVMAKLRAGTAEVLILSLVVAYASFIVAEHGLHLSGVMAVATAAVTLGVFGTPRLQAETGTALGETWEFLSLICNTLLFMLMGLSVDLNSLFSMLGSGLLAVLLVLVARASMIYTLVPFTTRIFGLPKVTLGERHIMWWGGLKGGLAIAIVLSIPPDLPGRQMLMDVTLVVVLFTLLVNAPTIRPLIHKLGIDRLTNAESAELKRGVVVARERATGLLNRFLQSGLLSRAGHHQVLEKASEALQIDTVQVAEEHSMRRQRLESLRIELEILQDLYKAGVVPQYTFLDLKGELQRKREHVASGQLGEERPGCRQVNPFLRLERGLIHWSREKNWAAGMLTIYQNRRTSNHLIKDIAH
ncbi:MAG: sodium:proton antiporter, partial [Gammaproteobacteria bacterium]|nr:sodium:proton antiporter [Gammaproteobacteria bacterium]